MAQADFIRTATTGRLTRSRKPVQRTRRAYGYDLANACENAAEPLLTPRRADDTDEPPEDRVAALATLYERLGPLCESPFEEDGSGVRKALAQIAGGRALSEP